MLRLPVNPSFYKMTSRDYIITSYKTSLIKDFEAGNKDGVKYFVAQHEICPTTQREHIQGYIMMKQPVRIPAIKNMLGDKALHAERRQGTKEQVCAGLSMKNLDLSMEKNFGGKNLCPLCFHFLFPYAG